jgi:hypothetical protein
MEWQPVLMYIALALGISVVLGYVLAFALSPKWRKQLERPKHDMLKLHKKLWKK